MYQTGDLISYGNMGVCKVVEITGRDLAGKKGQELYYVLKPLYQSCTISAPVHSTKVFTRPILSRDEAKRLIDRIPFIRAKAYPSCGVNQLTEHYSAALKTHDCQDLVELTMSIYAKKQAAERQCRKLGAVDERFMRRAEDLLFGELAAALGISVDQVSEYITARVDESRRKQDS